MNEPVVWQFDRYAKDYSRYNQIQKDVAKSLILEIEPKELQKVVDIGSGDGAIYQELLSQNISFKEFFAIDFSSAMLKRHPKSDVVEKLELNFNQDNFFETLKKIEPTELISSSALQWADDIDRFFYNISQLNSRVYFAIFTSNTFKTLHKVAKLKSPIYSKEYLQESISKYFFSERLFTREYRLFFEDRREIFKYIKKSGVSGGKQRLGFKEIKTLIQNYPFDFLEFEVLFLVANPKNSLSKL